MSNAPDRFSFTLGIITELMMKSQLHSLKTLEENMRIIYPSYDHKTLKIVIDERKDIKGFFAYGLFTDEALKAYQKSGHLPPFADFKKGNNIVVLDCVAKDKSSLFFLCRKIKTAFKGKKIHWRREYLYKIPCNREFSI